jgi:hypothetical protein
MAPQSRALSLQDFQAEYGDTFEVPSGYGLVMQYHPTNGTVTIEAVPDHHYTSIHSNCYAPAALKDVRLLHGGGSGTAVFHGYSPQWGSLVMKHANAKDTHEVLSLTKIQQELCKRHMRLISLSLPSNAAHNMQNRIPAFSLVYISPYHLRDRAHELWTSLRGNFWAHGPHYFGSNKQLTDRRKSDEPVGGRRTSFLMSLRSLQRLTPHTREQAGQQGMRRIRIRKTMESSDATIDLSVGLQTVNLEIPKHMWADASTIRDGHAFLSQLEQQLAELQEEEHWKVTLAQRTIGGSFPKNSAALLLSRQLQGDLLQGLIDEFVTVMRDLYEITLPEERNSMEQVRAEVEALKPNPDVTKLSKMADLMVGSAIRKNFHPTKGRFAQMRDFGAKFRDPQALTLMEDEIMPAQYLGQLLLRGTLLSDVFGVTDFQNPHTNCCLDRLDGCWMLILEHALSFRSGPATECIWTCGLTDAGLHNTFYSQDRGLELFDLGPAKSMPQPAFLTKFLMSFFHTAGMEEDLTTGSWVLRFLIHDEKLIPTKETQTLVPYLDHVFEAVLDRLMSELFENDDSIRQLLIEYVILQLLSDAAFCLGRWEEKGGGHQRNSEASKNLSKWLWRSLWDIYIATHVYGKYHQKEMNKELQ